MFFHLWEWSETQLKQVIVKIIVSKPFLLVSSFKTSPSDSSPVTNFVDSLQQVSQSPWHKHIRLRARFAATQEHLLVEQDFVDEQVHLISLSTSGGAAETPAGIPIRHKTSFILSCSHPYLVGSKLGRFRVIADNHTADWKWARLTFSENVSCVGSKLHNGGAVFLAWDVLLYQELILHLVMSLLSNP